MLPGWGSRAAERGGHFLRHPREDAALEKSLTIAQLLLKCSAPVEWWRSCGSSPGAAEEDFTETCENFFLLHQEGTITPPAFLSLPKRPCHPHKELCPDQTRTSSDFGWNSDKADTTLTMPSKTPQSATTWLCVNARSWDLKYLRAELGTKMFVTPHCTEGQSLSSCLPITHLNA